MKVTLISTDNNTCGQGIRNLSAYVKSEVETQLLFLPYDKDKYSEKSLNIIKDIIQDSSIIAFSTMTLTSLRTYDLVNRLKPLNKITIIGGIHATMFPEECLEYFDYVCVGEGEEAFLELLIKYKEKESLDDIKNIWTKQTKNEIRPLVSTDFIPDYDTENHFVLENDILVPFEERHFYNTFMIHTSRGCPHSCSYCCNNFIKKLYNEVKIRKKKTSVVVEEIELLKNKFPNVERIWFTDDSLFVRSVDELKELKTNLPFMCYVSPKTFNEEKLKILIQNGLIILSMGIQTGSERTNLLYGRKEINKDIVEISKKLSEYKIDINYQFMITNPYETNEDLLETIELIENLKTPFLLETFNLTFYKGTELYDKASSDGLVTETKADFSNLIGHLKSKQLKTAYLNSVIYFMSGNCTGKRYGLINKKVLKILKRKKVIGFFDKNIYMTSAMNIFLMTVLSLFYFVRGRKPRI